MRRLVLIIAAWLILATSVMALIPPDPRRSLLFNGFTSISVVDSFALATSHDGIIALSWSDSKMVYSAVNHLMLDSEPYQQKRTGDVLTVRSRANVIYFIDISSLPDLSLLGSADIGMPFYDYALFGQDIYIANGFKGLWRYSTVNFESATFADSSMIGVNVTKVDIYGSELFALDDYNGILRYQLTGIGFGQFVDYLYIPLRATSFARTDTTTAIALDRPKLMVARSGSIVRQITDTVDLLFTPRAVYAIDTLVIGLSGDYDMAEMVSRNTLEVHHQQLDKPLDSALQGTIYMLNDDHHLIIPGSDGGLTSYNLANIINDPTPIPIYPRPGPVTDVVVADLAVYSGGVGNPLDVIELDEDGNPIDQFPVYGGITHIGALHRAGDRLAILYSHLYHVLLFDPRGRSFGLEASIYVGPEQPHSIFYNPSRIDTLRSLFALSDNRLRAFTISDSSEVVPAFDIPVVDRGYAMEVMDSLMFVSTGKRYIMTYRIYDDFDVSYRSSTGVPYRAHDLASHNGQLVAVCGDQIRFYDVSDPMNLQAVSALVLPFPVEHSDWDGDRLVAVGISGFVIVDLSKGTPQLVDFGGLGGHRISADQGIMAMTNGSSVHMYDIRDIVTDVPGDRPALPDHFELAQNYPNPFNPITKILYSLPSRSTVRLTVFNVLGQEVATLVDTEEPAGEHEVEWNGTDTRGEPVASGVYFYRLQTPDFSDARKMILIK
jgi:hypothetical protein